MTVVVTTVLLDLDGVLLDHRHASAVGVRAWLGERWTPELETAWYAATDRFLAEWRAGRLGWEQQRRDRMRAFLPLLGETPGSDEQLDDLFASGYRAEYERAWRGFDDAAPTISTLHAAGFATAVLTNGSEEQQRKKLAALGLLDTIGPVFTAGGLGLRKPDPRAFQAACAGLRAAPTDVVYVGDEHEVDVLGARAAGLSAVLLDRDGTAPASEHAVIHTLTALPGFLAA